MRVRTRRSRLFPASSRLCPNIRSNGPIASVLLDHGVAPFRAERPLPFYVRSSVCEWSYPRAFRQPITGLLLRQFIREREADYAAMLRAVMHYVRDLPHLVAYLHGR